MRPLGANFIASARPIVIVITHSMRVSVAGSGSNQSTSTLTETSSSRMVRIHFVALLFGVLAIAYSYANGSVLLSCSHSSKNTPMQTYFRLGRPTHFSIT